MKSLTDRSFSIRQLIVGLSPSVRRWLCAIVFAVSLIACEEDRSTETVTQAPSSIQSYSFAWASDSAEAPFWAELVRTGALARAAKQRGIEIDAFQSPDVVTLRQWFESGKMDIVAFPLPEAIAARVNSRLLVLTSFSNSADAVVLKGGRDIGELKSREVLMDRSATSEVLLAAALADAGLSMADVRPIRLAADDIADQFLARGRAACVAGNLALITALDAPGANVVYDAKALNGGLFTGVFARDSVADEARDAISAAWFEQVAGDLDAGSTLLAEKFGVAEPVAKRLLSGRTMFPTADSAAAFMARAELPIDIREIRQLLKSQGVDIDPATIVMPDGVAIGDQSPYTVRLNKQPAS